MKKFCETCKQRDAGGFCNSPFLLEGYDQMPESSRPEDTLIYSYVEDGSFYVGKRFGCVHHEELSK